jgi:hypothetical protein
MNNITVKLHPIRFILSERDYQVLSMVSYIVDDCRRAGMDVTSAYRKAKLVVDGLPFTPVTDVKGKQSGVVMELDGSSMTVIGGSDIGVGDMPTARVILGDDELVITVVR